MNLSTRPLWLVGFRPFFALACVAGAGLPLLWALLLSGLMPAPNTSFSLVQWHAHEMFFGFGWAVLGGFLLTSTKNWVQVRGYHGGALLFLVAAWVLERVGMWCQDALPWQLFRISNNLFLISIVAMLLWTLLRNRSRDTYADNYYFLLILPAFLVAKSLLLSGQYYQVGWSMALGLFRMAFLVMLERTLTQFMKGVFQVDILRNATLDKSIKLLGLAMVFESLMPPLFSGSLALLLATLLTVRWLFWQPQLALRRLEIGVMYLGYLAIVAQLVVHFFARVTHVEWVGTVSVHLFTFGTMGLIIPAMLVRISKGHTGRKVVFDRGDKLVLWIMMLGFIARILAPQLYPVWYANWIYLAAACWFLCFTILAWRYLPFLLQARVDGKEH